MFTIITALQKKKKVHALILDFEKWLFADEKKERD
jgi:hypothetical protein